MTSATIEHRTPVPDAESFYLGILDSLADGVYFVDPQRRITYWNRAAGAISGYSAQDAIGRSCRDNLLQHTNVEGRPLCAEGCPLVATLRDGASRQVDAYIKHRNGHRVPVTVRLSPMVDAGERIIGAVEVFSENSSKLAALEKAAEMERLALIDPLTLAGNRRYAERVLAEQSALFNRGGDSFAVLFLDLDHFKAVNDAHGHDAGDAVLKAVTRTFMNSLRCFDFVGRWGGEEFIAILIKADGEHAAAVASRCCALVRSCAVDWAGQVIRPTVSIGVAVIQPGECTADLVARADTHMYQAKRAGRDQICGP